MPLSRALIIVFLAGLLASIGLYVFRFHHPKTIYPVRGEFIKVEGARIYFVSEGEGRPVLLLHGFPYHLETYQNWLAHPPAGFRLIALDFPGMGLSEATADTACTPEGYALAVKLFLDKLEIKQADLIGHDFGGGVAMVLAAQYPTLVRKLVLLAPDSSHGQAGATDGWWQRLPVVSEVWAAVFLGRGYIRRTLARAWSREGEGWREAVEAYVRPLDADGGRKHFLALLRSRHMAAYRVFEERLQAPTLILWGEADRVVASASGQALVKRLGSARLDLLPGVGHLPQEESPEETWRRIAAFLQE